MLNMEKHHRAWLLVFLMALALYNCDTPEYHPESMSLQREAMKVYKRKPDSALSVLDKAIEMDPSYYVAYNTKALVFQRKSEYDRAIAELHKSLRWNEDQPEVHLQLGMLNEQLNRLERAGDAYNRAAALFDLRLAAVSSHPVDDQVNRAITDVLRGETAAGVKQLTRLNSEHPDHPILKMLHRGNIHSDPALIYSKARCLEVLFDRNS